MKDLTDEQLIEKYLKGDKTALEFLIARYLKAIYGFAYSLCGDKAIAEDITQEAFVKIWKNINKFDLKKKFKPWLFQITKNTAIDFSRKRKTIPFSKFENELGENVLLETLRDSKPLALEAYYKKDQSLKLREAIQKLSLKYRQVVLMRLNEEFTFEEIARTLDESVNTVKSRYRRAILELKHFLMPNI
jgi:RNA polymerase sigma-70 factor (ECF subfamily)